MKKIVVVFLMIVLGSLQVSAETISIRADVWKPYNCEPNSKEPGYMVEIAKKIFEKHGYKIDYDILPWTRAIEETRKGKIDAIVGAAKGDAPDFIFPQNEQGISANATMFIKKGGKWRYTDLESLKTEQVGIINGYSYGEKVDKYLKNNPSIVQVVSGENALELNIKKLIAGKISVIVEDRVVIAYKIKEMNVQNDIEEAGSDGSASKIYIAFSPANNKSDEYAKILSEGMDIIRKNGELKNILNKYGIKDWK